MDEELRSPDYNIIMRSAWSPSDSLGRTHRFSLAQYHDDVAQDSHQSGSIAVTLAEYHQEELFIKHVAEDAGPLVFDCPADILNRAEEFRPLNNTALEWRTQCRRT